METETPLWRSPEETLLCRMLGETLARSARLIVLFLMPVKRCQHPLPLLPCFHFCLEILLLFSSTFSHFALIVQFFLHSLLAVIFMELFLSEALFDL